MFLPATLILTVQRLDIRSNWRTFSIHRVSMTMARELLSHTILQKSSRVEGSGPCVTMNSLGELYPWKINITVKHDNFLCLSLQHVEK